MCFRANTVANVCVNYTEVCENILYKNNFAVVCRCINVVQQ